MNHHTKHKYIEQECFSLLAQSGVRVNHQLRSLIEYFFSTDKHISRQDLRYFIQEHNLEIDESVIQEALDLLVEYGFALKKSFDNEVTLYEHLHLDEHHDHFYCTKCGSIKEFLSPALEQLQIEESKKQGFHAFTHKLLIYGLCQNCFEKSSRSQISLANVHSGGKFRVLSIKKSPDNNNLRNKIHSLGIIPGYTGEIITNHSGRLVVASAGGRIALNRDLSSQIMVKLEN